MTSLTLIPLLVVLFACLIVAFLIRKHTPENNFEREYFVAGRRLGPIVLVMTTIATFGSITAFVGMPGQAWEYGFGWVYLAGAQVVSLILLFGVVGKKLALIARRIHAVSIIDIVNARFRSSILTLILSWRTRRILHRAHRCTARRSCEDLRSGNELRLQRWAHPHHRNYRHLYRYRGLPRGGDHGYHLRHRHDRECVVLRVRHHEYWWRI